MDNSAFMSRTTLHSGDVKLEDVKVGGGCVEFGAGEMKAAIPTDIGETRILNDLDGVTFLELFVTQAEIPLFQATENRFKKMFTN